MRCSILLLVHVDHSRGKQHIDNRLQLQYAERF